MNDVVCIYSLPTNKNGILNRQGYYVYSSNGISINITAQTGGLGGSSGIYLEIKKENINA